MDNQSNYILILEKPAKATGRHDSSIFICDFSDRSEGVEDYVEERRRFERFSLKLPAKITPMAPGGEQETFDFWTRDVSAGGVYFNTEKPIPGGTRVRLELMVANEFLKKLTGAQGHLEVAGTVVNSSPGGMALCFDEEYSFTRKEWLHNELHQLEDDESQQIGTLFTRLNNSGKKI